MLGRRFTVPGFRVAHRVVALSELRDRLGCDVVALPSELCVIGWDDDRRRWLVDVHATASARYRLAATLRFLEHRVRPQLPAGSFWFVCCLEDGWRERVPVASIGVAPGVSATRDVVLCFAARRGDTTGILLPECHYLERFHYARFRVEARLRRDHWDAKEPTAIYCGGAHGRPLERDAHDPDAPSTREVLRRVVEHESLPARVHLGTGVSRREQAAHKYLLDVDGFVRTFDAWAWKLLSGSVVLSQASPWETFFTRQFEPWRHFVPVREDFSDLGDQLAWCREHDDECRAIAARARARALEVYSIADATRQTVEQLSPWLR